MDKEQWLNDAISALEEKYEEDIEDCLVNERKLQAKELRDEWKLAKKVFQEIKELIKNE